jgi:hypothetical protein
MGVVSFKGIQTIDENVLATYLAYKAYYPNSIITKRSALHVFKSKRTKEKSYQVINRQIKLLLEHGMIANHLDGWRLISKIELAKITDGRDNVLFVKLPSGNVKQNKIEITLSKIATKLNQIEFRKLTKSKRPTKSLRSFLKKEMAKNIGAFTQISYTTLSKYCGISRDKLRRIIKLLYEQCRMSIIAPIRSVVRRISKLEEPMLQSGEFIYKGTIYHVESPHFRVNSDELMKLIQPTT